MNKDSSQKKDRGPCEIDLYDDRQVVQRFRDLINVGPLLNIDVDEEIYQFRQELKKFGYGHDAIRAIQERACISSRYESELEHPIRNLGNRRVYEANKGRVR